MTIATARPVPHQSALGWSLAALCTFSACSDGTTPAGPVGVAQPAPTVATDPASPPGPIAMRRLTRAQYVSTLHALFGQDLDVLPPTEVDLRTAGLQSVGAAEASITAAGMERYELAARQAASQVFSLERRARVLDCAPGNSASADAECAGQFVRQHAPRVLRRSLRPMEDQAYIELAGTAADRLGDFHAGLEAVLAGWLLSPDFLFIQEHAEPAVDGEPVRRLTAETLASRLSYFFWGQGPDAPLLEDALTGALHDEDVYAAQVERLSSDPARLEQGVRAFFADLYELEDLDHVQKDQQAFPRFTVNAAQDAREQLLRMLVDHLLVRREDYRDVVTTRRTFMTRNLAAIYDVGAGQQWEATEFPEDGLRAGVLAHVAVLSLNARAARSSPVLRGLFVLNKLLCTEIPPPPDDVTAEALAEETGAGNTARERLVVHLNSPECAGCHGLIDPIGLALENFNAIGRLRTMENGTPIETYGSLDGVDFADVREFYEVLHDSSRLTHCAVRQLQKHALGREILPSDRAALEALETGFAGTNHDFVALMQSIAMSPAFRTTSGPRQQPAADEEDR